MNPKIVDSKIVDMKVCAGIVTFNPNLRLLTENIEAIYKQVNQIIIFDNGSDNVNEIEGLIIDKNIHLIKCELNKGIAFALNRLCEWAYNNEYKWILTLDQDSISPSNLVSELKPYSKYKGIAIIAPEIIYRNNEKYTVVRKKNFKFVNWVITSASLTNTSIWKKIHGFDEKLFIDCVDFDYGVRVNRAGYKIIKVFSTYLLHDLGKLKCRQLFGKTIYITNHSANRYYYMVRNNIYLKKKLNVGKPIWSTFKHIVKIVFFERDKCAKMLSIMKGIKDGMAY